MSVLLVVLKFSLAIDPFSSTDRRVAGRERKEATTSSKFSVTERICGCDAMKLTGIAISEFMLATVLWRESAKKKKEKEKRRIQNSEQQLFGESRTG
jgi:hypothetical protein